MSLQENLDRAWSRIREACARTGRKPDEVAILPVTKKVGFDRVREAASCGLRVFGESRVQEAKQKIPLCPGNLEWHMVGHLQQNKVRDAVHLFSMIHSVDSLRLMEAVDSACDRAGRTMRVCIEVNVSGESSKFGLPPGEARSVLEASGKLVHIDVVGLMTIPPLADDPEKARSYFCRLRELRDELAGGTGIFLKDLSMGMSNDFEVAVEEGATWVRLGAILFGARKESGE